MRSVSFLVVAAALAASAPRVAAGEDPASAPGGASAGRPPDRAAKGQRTLKLSLREAVDLALRNNLDLRAALYGPEIAGTRVAEAESLYDHLFTARVSGGETKFPVATTLAATPTSVGPAVSNGISSVRPWSTNGLTYTV